MKIALRKRKGKKETTLYLDAYMGSDQKRIYEKLPFRLLNDPQSPFERRRNRENQEKGKERVVLFRKWFAENKYLLESDVEKFIFRMQANFPEVGEINPKFVDFTNSGNERRENYSLEELESSIDALLRSAGIYFIEHPEIQLVIKHFQKLTFLGYMDEEIYKNETGLNDDRLKEFLRFYHETFKVPVIRLLNEYYKVLYNPKMEF